MSEGNFRDSHAIWQSVLGEIEVSISSSMYTMWFTNTKLEINSDSDVTIVVSNIFVKENIKKRYFELIRSCLNKHGLNIGTINVDVDSSKRVSKTNRDTPREAPARKQPVEELLIQPGKKLNPGNLNPRYTFDNFIVGSSNDLAHAACQAVATNPGTKYNPLYLYGSAGLGKTHLMQAVGNEILRRQPSARVLYTTIETFYKDYLESVRFKKQGYADKYRNVDVLIVDDMQFIAGKEKSQEEFFHTFNELHQNDKQIIISSDKPPKSIPTLTDRLRSRFEWGMAIDIQMPDFETRQAIIETKAELSGFKLDQETTNFLASNIRTNIRELEGTLNQLLAIAEMRGVQPDAEMAEGMISETIRTNRPQHLTYKKIIDKASKFYQIPKDDLLGRSRTKDINRARQVSCYLMKYELKMSFPQIGAVFGRDHSTIINGVTNIEKSLKLDLAMREQINALVESIYE